jgi:hypothetical protein
MILSGRNWILSPIDLKIYITRLFIEYGSIILILGNICPITKSKSNYKKRIK